MNIVLISENEKIRNQTTRILDKEDSLDEMRFHELNSRIFWDYDILVIHFDKAKVSNKEFKTILDLNCKGKVPILALLEESSVLDQFEVLALGAVDYLELPVSDENYKKKVQELYKWKWFYNWGKKNAPPNNDGSR